MPVPRPRHVISLQHSNLRKGQPSRDMMTITMQWNAPELHVLPFLEMRRSVVANTTLSCRSKRLGVQDLTFGQLIGGINLYGFKIPAPLFILNWTQELQPDGLSWRRRSSALLQNTSGGDYFWRKIVDGLGKPTKYWDGWLADYGGRPFAYISSAT